MGDLLAGMPLAPPYFSRMKQVNRQGPPILGRNSPARSVGDVKQLHERTCEGCLIIDVRPPRSRSPHAHPRLDQHSVRP